MSSKGADGDRSRVTGVAKGGSGIFDGTRGNPQRRLELILEGRQPTYVPSPKHEPGHGWGSDNPIGTISEGQHLLDTGYVSGRQVYNVTSEGKVVKFQPDNSPLNGYHAYEVTGPRDIPTSVLRQMLEDGKISRSTYSRLRRGKR